MIDAPKNWLPPFYLYAAGRGSAATAAYRHDAARDATEPRRLLIKYTASGCGVLYVRGERREVPAGHLFMIERPGPYVYCYEGDGERWRFEYVSIAFSSPSGLLPEEWRNDPVFNLAGHEELRRLLRELIDLRLTPGHRPDLLDSALAYRFVLSCVGRRRQLRREPSPVAEKLRQVLIAAVSDHAFDLAAACRRLGYTPEALIRLFHRAYGLPPGRYLQEERLRLADELLRRGELKIKEVAERCGFASPNYFARLFRQRRQLTPEAYRRHPDPLQPDRER